MGGPYYNMLYSDYNTGWGIVEALGDIFMLQMLNSTSIPF